MKCVKRVQLRKLPLITKDMKRTGEDGFWKRKVEETPPRHPRHSPVHQWPQQRPPLLTKGFWSAKHVIKKYHHRTKYTCVKTITYTPRESEDTCLMSRYQYLLGSIFHNHHCVFSIAPLALDRPCAKWNFLSWYQRQDWKKRKVVKNLFYLYLHCTLYNVQL